MKAQKSVARYFAANREFAFHSNSSSYSSIHYSLISDAAKPPSEVHAAMGCLLSKAIEDNPLPLSDTLPCEIIFEVLSRVPSKSLLRFRCVSKSWRNLFCESHFLNMHANNFFRDQLILRDNMNFLYSLDFRNSSHRLVHIDHKRFKSCTKIWGSCNGLLCIQRDSDEFSSPSSNMSDLKCLCIWNPSTKDCTTLPAIKENNYIHVAYGFAYNQKIKNSQVVCIICKGSSIGSDVRVYSPGNESWKLLPGRIPYKVSPKHGVVVNGRLHWLAVSRGERSRKVIAFRAEDENFMDVGELPHSIKYCESAKSVGEFGGKLCVFHTGSSHSTDFDLWVMNVYGIEESWTKLFTIAKPKTGPAGINGFVLGLTRSSLVVMKGDDNNLILYDPITGYRYVICRKPKVAQLICI